MLGEVLSKEKHLVIYQLEADKHKLTTMTSL